MKKYILCICCYIALFLCVSFAGADELQLSAQIKVALAKKEALVRSLLTDPKIISAVEEANSHHASLSAEERNKLDLQWRATKGIDGLVKKILTNTCSELLLDFQDQHSEFAELFLTDIHGLNVCQSNKTSDYVQSDEEWWIKSYAEGKGVSYTGGIEYDESAHSESIALFIPIITPENKSVIGIAKAVLNITALQQP